MPANRSRARLLIEQQLQQEARSLPAGDELDRLAVAMDADIRGARFYVFPLLQDANAFLRAARHFTGDADRAKPFMVPDGYAVNLG